MCSGTPAETVIPTVLKHTDAVIIVSTVGATGGDALDTLMAEIGPWRDKIIGNVLLSRRAP